MSDENLKDQLKAEIGKLEGEAKKDFATANGFIETHYVVIAACVGFAIGLLVGAIVGAKFFG